MPDTEPVLRPAQNRELAVVDLLDRVLAGGVVVRGELSIGVADVELVRVSLRAVVASVSALAEQAQADSADREQAQ